MRTIEESLASSRERRASLAAAVAEARRRAEEAVVARDDDAARRELAAGRWAKEHLAAVERESDVRERLLGEWLRLAELPRAE